MRIDQLDLMPFGQFSDHSLVLPEAGLTIVYGLNGAGKTTVKRAVGDFFFGVPARSQDVWKFGTSIRVGASLSGLDGGAPIGLVRHKGNKETLKDREGSVVGEEILDSVLGGLTREKFEALYSITQNELRTGGQELASGEGELASLVFSAGLGSSQVSALLSGLEQEADDLYRSRGRTQTITRKIKEYKDQRNKASEMLVRPDEWTRKEQELERAESDRKRVREEIGTLTTALAKKQRHIQLKPMLLQHDQLVHKEEAIELSDSVNAGTRARRESAEKNLLKAKEDLSVAQEEIDGIDAHLGSLEVNELLIRASVEVENLGRQASVVEKALADEAKLVVQLETAEADVAASLRDLGSEADETVAAAMTPTSAEEEEIRRLAEAWKEFDRTRKQELENIRTLEEEIADKRSELEQLGDEGDGERIKDAGQAATAEGPIEQEVDELSTKRTGIQRSLEQGVRDLFGFEGGLEEFRELEVPVRQSIKEMEARLAGLVNELNRCERSLAEVREELIGKEADLKAVSASGPVPSMEDLEEARAFRERGWQAVLSSWKGGEEGPGEDFASGSPLPEAYQRAVGRADEVSDDLRENASKVSKVAALKTEISRLEDRVARLEEEREGFQEARAEFDRDWGERWTRSGVEPQDPAVMLEWTEDVRNLKKLINEIDELDVLIRNKVERVALHTTELEEALGSQDVTSNGQRGQNRRLGGLLEIGRRRLEEISKTNKSRTALELAIAERSRRLDTAKGDLKAAEDGLREWEEQWASLTEAFPSDRLSGPEGILGTLEVLRELEVRQRLRDELARRVRGIGRDVTEFVEELVRLAGAVEIETDSIDRKNAVAQVWNLQKRLTEAFRSQQEIEALQQASEGAKTRERKARTSLTDDQKALDRLLEQAGVEHPNELEELEVLFEEKVGIRDKRTALEAEVLQIGGESLEALVSQVEGLDVDELSADIRELEGEIQKHEEMLGDLDETVSEIKAYQLQADRTEDALRAGNAAEQLANELRDDIEQYAKLRLASEMLRRAMASYREDAEGPVLKKASALFSSMTGDVFQGLETVEEDDGNAVLVARRLDELATPVPQLSDGERDALYLAFRVASIEYQFEKLEPSERIPIILDDVFVSMDDERARVGLQSLSKLSEGCQVIFLTHHDHLVNLARESLPAHAFGVAQLERPAPVRASSPP